MWIVDHLVVPEAQHLPTTLFEMERTGGIVFHRYLVLAPVQLNNNPRFLAGEVRKTTVDRMLPPELETTQLTSSEHAPHLAFDVGLIATKTAGAENSASSDYRCAGV